MLMRLIAGIGAVVLTFVLWLVVRSMLGEELGAVAIAVFCLIVVLFAAIEDRMKMPSFFTSVCSIAGAFFVGLYLKML